MESIENLLFIIMVSNVVLVALFARQLDRLIVEVKRLADHADAKEN